MSQKVRTLVLGAAGRDFHDFLVALRDDPGVEVVGFTGAQIPGIEQRRFPAELAGGQYPQGLPIFPERELERLVRDLHVDEVVLSYSDLSHASVMHLASRALASGAGFRLLSPSRTCLRSRRPVVAVTAVRTGCGKSQVARAVARLVRASGKRVVVVRHPMPYGDLVAQRVQRFETVQDLDEANVTIEEREDYGPHVEAGSVVFAGVDYAALLARAEEEADVVVWDGGNNDLPFFQPDLWITVVDPHRPGHETGYHPGETNLRRADLVLVNKIDSAPPGGVEAVRAAVEAIRPGVPVVLARSRVTVDAPELVRGKRVLLLEDGPTCTHGEMAYGAATVAARLYGAREVVDPRPFAVGTIAEALRRYPHVGPLIPAVGYSAQQVRDLEATLAAVECDTILAGTPIDLGHVLHIERPWTRVRYELEEAGAPGEPTLASALARFLDGSAGAAAGRLGPSWG